MELLSLAVPLCATVIFLSTSTPAAAVTCPICTLGCTELNCPHGIGIRTNPCDCCPPCALGVGESCTLKFSCAPGLICAPSGGEDKKLKFCQPPGGLKKESGVEFATPSKGTVPSTTASPSVEGTTKEMAGPTGKVDNSTLNPKPEDSNQVTQNTPGKKKTAETTSQATPGDSVNKTLEAAPGNKLDEIRRKNSRAPFYRR